MTVTKFDIAYNFDELTQIVSEVEDHILNFRNIRVEPETIDLITDFLYKNKYTPAQYSLAKLWIEKGSWAISKRELVISDFYPTSTQIDFAHDQLLTKEFAQRRSMALQTDFDIQLRNERDRWKKEYLTKDQIAEEQAQIKQMADFALERLILKQKIDELVKNIKILDKENIRLNNIIQRRNENKP